MKKLGLCLFSAVLLMGLCSSLQQSPVKESVIDEDHGLSAVSLRNIQIGTQESVKVSPTYVQVGKRMSTNNYF